MPKEKLEDLIEVQGRVQATKHLSSDLALTKLWSVDSESFEICTIEDLSNTYWMEPVVEYLKNPVGSSDRKVKYRFASYVIIGNELFKKTLEGVLLKFLGEEDAYLAVSNTHSGHVVLTKWGTK